MAGENKRDVNPGSYKNSLRQIQLRLVCWYSSALCDKKYHTICSRDGTTIGTTPSGVKFLMKI